MIGAENIVIPGCDGPARIGINSEDPGSIYSPNCVRESNRLLKCECEQGIELYSENNQATYNIIIDYEDAGVAKTKTLYNISFKDDYVNTELNGFIGRLVLGLIAPILIVIIVMVVSKKILSKGDKDSREKEDGD